jgi:DNA repair photolyase
VRWKSQLTDEDDRQRLPGYADGAVVRTFDAPEALETRFYEVRAKSALNRVPERSRMPFRWTVNPYRGCAHECLYCCGPETPVLLADGRYRPIADLQVGDEIIGTRRDADGRSRRYVRTEVRDVWWTVKPAWRTVLGDGTELVTSGDHRFLSRHGWTHVHGTEDGGPLRRLHLTVGTQLLGPGGHAAAPEPDEDLRQGWLCVVATTGSAVLRKRGIEGMAVQRSDALEVVAVEPLGRTMPLVDITTGTGDFVSAGVVSHNCFARPTHEFLGFDAGRDFAKEIVVKVNVPEVLAAELRRPSWMREHVAMGTNTDPYQWVEGRYRLMRGIWAALRDARTPCSVVTKSPLVLRDLDLLREIQAVSSVGMHLSIPTVDERAWRATEPHTPNPWARMEAVRALNAAGVPCGVLVAPLMPGINDNPEDVRRILEAAADAGAVNVGGTALYLRGAVKDVFLAFLRDWDPELHARYEELYARGAYLSEAEQQRVFALLEHPDGLGPPRERFGRAVEQVQPAAGRGRGPAAGEVPVQRTRHRPAPQESLF